MTEELPRLAATMVDPQLQSVKGNILADQRQGMVGHVRSSCTRRSRRCRRRPRRLQALLHASPGSLTPSNCCTRPGMRAPIPSSEPST